MAETLPVRLPSNEIIRQGKEFFGAYGLGMALVADQQTTLRFEGADGFVALELRPDGGRQVRLTIEHHGYEVPIREFRRVLANESKPGRAALPGKHHLPRDRFP